MPAPVWTRSAPRRFDIVTGFFPEKKPKHNWETNPRPMLVTGVFFNPDSDLYSVRVAYGTGETAKVNGRCLVVGNISQLDRLKLAKPTAFVLTPGSAMMILPWLPEYFQPWTGETSPILSHLPQDMESYVLDVIKYLGDLPYP